MKIGGFCLLILFSAGCTSAEAPVAKLSFSSIYKAGTEYSIIFRADRDMESFFSYNGKKVVVQRLVCALDEDRDFKIEHDMHRFFRGDLTLQEKETEHRYRYVSNGNFFTSLDNGGHKRVIQSDEVLRLLADEVTIDCKVVMTIYLSKPYYSDTMKIPVVAMTDVLKAAAAPRPCCDIPRSE